MPIINTVTGGGTGKPAKLVSTTVEPASFPTTYTPPEGFDGWSDITVTKPTNLEPTNIRKGVTIASVEGTYESVPNLQDKTVKPEVFPTEVVNDEGYGGLGTVTVTSPDNLSADNIKSGVSIAGVTGSYEGEGDKTPLEDKMLKIFSKQGGVSVTFEELASFCTEIRSTWLCDCPLDELIIDTPEEDYYRYIGTTVFALNNFTSFYNNKNLPMKMKINIKYATPIVKGIFSSLELTSPGGTVGAGSSVWYVNGDVVFPEGITILFQIPKIFGYDTESQSSSSLKVYGGSVVLPSTLEKLNGSLTSFTNYGIKLKIRVLALTPPKIQGAYDPLPYVASVTVPKGSLEAYKSATNWSAYADIMVEAEE